MNQIKVKQIHKLGLNIKRLFPEQFNNAIYLLTNAYKFPYKFKHPSFLASFFEYPSQKYRVYLRYVL